MPEFVINILLMGSGAILALLGVLVGGWLMFRGKVTTERDVLWCSAQRRGVQHRHRGCRRLSGHRGANS